VTATPAVARIRSPGRPPAGGSAITGYTVHERSRRQDLHTTGALTCVVDSLTNGQPYTFTVTAGNVVGTGPASDPSAPVTPFPGATYRPVPPVRLLDTRFAKWLTGKLVAYTPRTFQIATARRIPGRCDGRHRKRDNRERDLRASLYLGPTAIARPSTFTIRFNRNDTTAFGVTVALSGAAR